MCRRRLERMDHAVRSTQALMSRREMRGDDAIFRSIVVPQISLADYAKRFNAIDTDLSTSLIQSIYIGRLNKKLSITEWNCHRIYLTTFVLAKKYNEDEGEKFSEYAAVGGVLPIDLLRMELAMTKILEYKLHVSAPEYAEYRRQMYGLYERGSIFM